MKTGTPSGDQQAMEVNANAAVPSPVPSGAGTLDISTAYADHAPFIGRVICRLVGHSAPIDDILQDTFVIAFKKREGFGGRANVRTWLYAIAAHLCLRYRRSVHRFTLLRARLPQEEVLPAVERPDGRLERRQGLALVEEVLEKLPFKQREVFVLYEVEGMEGGAIADLLGIPVGTVWTRLHSARQRFQLLTRRRLEREMAP